MLVYLCDHVMLLHLLLLLETSSFYLENAALIKRVNRESVHARARVCVVQRASVG